MRKLVVRLRTVRARRDDGASAVEYGLLVALIAVAIAATIGFLGTALDNRLEDACEEISAAGTCP